MFKRILILTSVLVLITTLVSVVFLSPTAKAVTASDWRAGRIIDDAVFTDANSMSVAEIQNFLNQNVGKGGYDSVPGQCDTNGARSARPLATGTRADYAASLGKPRTFTCLNNYYEVPKTSPGPNIPASNYGGQPIPSGAKSAAQLIWDAAQASNISPRVLLVMIHKESSGPLTIDDWPFQSQYTYAMGAYCPDSRDGPRCNSNYAGFSIQIAESAALLRYYLDNMQQPWWDNKKPYQNNNILWQTVYGGNGSPTNCGGSNVYIENKATAALYVYTPYQPNAAALANMYGTGDFCSAYGNRNFWRIYNDWFGNTYGSPPYLRIPHPDGTLVHPAAGPNASSVYVLKDGGAAYATSLGVFQSWGFNFNKVKIATPGDLNLMAAADADSAHVNTPAPLQFREGTLVRGSEPKVYVVQNVGGVNHKRSIDSLENFVRLGYSFNDVINIPDTELSPIPEDPALTVSTPAHPNGTLIRDPNEPTVYYVINGERHSMTSGAILYSHGFSWQNVKIATPGDKQLPITWPVTWYGEGTILKGSGPTIYVVDLDVSGVNMYKRSFGSYYNFAGLDYKFGEVRLVNDSALPSQNEPDIGS